MLVFLEGADCPPTIAKKPAPSRKPCYFSKGALSLACPFKFFEHMYSIYNMSIWSESITQCAKEQLGINSLLPVQQLVIHNIMEALYPELDNDVYHNQLVILPTGTGKSACFQIPAFLSHATSGTPTIIIYPLLSLINDQLRRLNQAGIVSHKIVGGMTQSEIKTMRDALDKKECVCILTNPEALENPQYISLLSQYNPRFAVVDESHCISKWGKSFRPSYVSIGEKIEHIGIDSIVAFTATASDEIIDDIKTLLFLNKDTYILRGHANRENITYSTLYCTDRDAGLVSLLQPYNNQKEPQEEESEFLGMYPVQKDFSKIERPALIFCSSRVACSRLALLLRDNLQEQDIFFYHAGMNKQEKNKIEDWFLHSEHGILIATCAYGMGVDKSNIRTVIHYEPFTDIENFLQETGRAGRDTLPSKSIILADYNSTQINTDALLLCRREYYMSALGLECEGCTGCDICTKYFPIIPNECDEIISLVSKYNRCFTQTELLEKIISLKKKNKSFKGLYETHMIEKAISMLIKNKMISKGKFAWRHKLFV